MRSTDLICQVVRCYVVLHSLHLDSIAAQSRMPRNSASEFMGKALFCFPRPRAEHIIFLLKPQIPWC